MNGAHSTSPVATRQRARARIHTRFTPCFDRLQSRRACCCAMNLTRRQVVIGIAAATAAAGSAHAARVESAARAFEVEHVDVELPDLDEAHEGVKVAQLSDLHVGIGTPDGRIIEALRAAERHGAELLLLTGDYVTTKADPHERVGQLLSNTKLPAFAVLGNHDHWTHAAELRSGIERANITVLQNEHTVTRVRGRAFTLYGIDDAHSGHADVERTFKGSRFKGSSLVLAHTPVTADALPQDKGLFCMSGHTHGGQWYIPRFTDRVFKIAKQPYVRGRYGIRGNQLYVNRGIGFGRGGYGVRVNSPPEVSIFTLRRAKS